MRFNQQWKVTAMRVLTIAITLALACLTSPSVMARPLLLISIDGLRPGDVAEADKRGLHIPNLRRFLREGSHAEAVIGVLPTLTYPSHTTILTGVGPAQHGIVNNTTFDPQNINRQGWFWYSSDIKVPTLWDAVRRAGKSTANVHWPVSVGQPSIDYNIPQIWHTGHAYDEKLLAALATPGLLSALEQKLGPYARGVDESIEGDEIRARFAAAIIAEKRPYFMTAYLTALDHEQHASGPDTPAAHAVLERIDAIVGQLIAAERTAQPDADIAVVSDHGFAPVTTEINLYSSFVKAGLIRFDKAGAVSGWDAMPWPSGGSLAIVLARPDDRALHDRVAQLLATLKATPEARIDAILDKEEIAAMGGNPAADFYIAFGKGAMAASTFALDAPLAVPSAHYKGMHGYFPTMPEMRSTFMMMGPDIPVGQSIGTIDMRRIAPRLAEILDVSLAQPSR